MVVCWWPGLGVGPHVWAAQPGPHARQAGLVQRLGQGLDVHVMTLSSHAMAVTCSCLTMASTPYLKEGTYSEQIFAPRDLVSIPHCGTTGTLRDGVKRAVRKIDLVKILGKNLDLAQKSMQIFAP